MIIQYDPEVDALYITLVEGQAVDSDEVQPGVIVDYDSEDHVIGVEVLSVSKRTAPINLADLHFQAAAHPAEA